MPQAGSTFTLGSSWTDPDSGVATDPMSLSVSILNGSAVVAGPFINADKISTGNYSYDFEIPSGFQGTYTARWAAVFASGTTYAFENFSVIGSATGTITGVTADDVANITGATVTDALVLQAISVIELYAGVSLTNFSAFAARNRTWLQKAVAYQAAWMLDQIDVYGRSDFTAQSQDGLSVTTRDRTTLVLAPYAKKALSRVSWIRPRSFQVGLGRHQAGSAGSWINTYPDQPYTEADFDRAEAESTGTVGDWLPVDWAS